MPKKIKVLECIRQGQIGGGESHLLSLVEHLDKDRFEPVVLSFTEGPMVDRLRQMKIPVEVIHTTRPFDFTKWNEVKKFIRNQKVDLVHAHGTRANSNVLWASRSLGLPVIYTIHGWSFHPDQRPIVRKIRILGEQYLTSKSDLNISVSASNQQTGKEFMPSFQSTVVNNGIDLQKFDPSRSLRDIRMEMGIPNNKLLVIFIARFTSHKQPLSLIKAFSNALKVNKELHLLMVGDGDEKEKAIGMIREYGLQNNITLSPFRQDVPDVLAAADIFVLPSLWEGLPIGLLEAMSMGKAIIASRVDGTREIIRHGESGWMVDPENLVENLAEALVSLSANSAQRKQFGENARADVQLRFNVFDMTRQIELIYSQLAASNTRKKIPALMADNTAGQTEI
jgi:glycosyltransferase involved in cell wall biosynthesis